MADAAAPAKAAPKAKKAAKPKKAATHPKYSEMIAKAIAGLKERGGSSRQAILKYILTNYNVGSNPAAVNSRIKLALKSGVAKGALKQAKGWYFSALYFDKQLHFWQLYFGGIILFRDLFHLHYNPGCMVCKTCRYAKLGLQLIVFGIK